MLSGLAAAATATTVSIGIVGGSPVALDRVQAATSISRETGTLPTAAQLARREEDQASRSDSRDTADPAKTRALSAVGGRATTVTDDARDDDPRDVAKALLSSYGWSGDQFGCLDSLWTRESGWRIDADNPSSSAYGIPQALPGSKMASAGPDWQSDPVTQIRWGLGYIRDRYGSPCGAWAHSESHNWY